MNGLDYWTLCFRTFAVFCVALSRISDTCVAQKISTQPTTYEVRVGDSVELPCHFSELDAEEKVVVWKRGLDVLAIDDELTNNDNRFQIKRDGLNYILSIVSLEPYDSADYTCSVTSIPPVEITHKLQVNVSPAVKLTPSSSTPVLVRAGEEVIVKCSGSGNPPPEVSWSRKSGWGKHAVPMPSHSHTAHGRLRIERVQVADSGVYECRASNGVGDDALAEIEIKVEASEKTASAEERESVTSAPWVETDRLYIPVAVGSDANITCRYKGQPEPTVDWLFNGFKINPHNTQFRHSTQLGSFDGNSSLTVFSLKDIHEDQFGRPGPPALLLRGNTLSWTVQSVAPVSEYKVHYRLPEEDTWKTDQSGDNWEHSVSLDFLQPNTEYELQLSAKNNIGWGSLARDTVVYEPGESGAVQPNKLTKDDSNSAIASSWTTFTLSLPLILISIFVF
ncbi:immunoglobulin domain-containing protein [Ditylenchus destructor]|uniref:Immunoglobulin domain-containing protein n=1 Tax=Ditylenchus destructor TaxID=166010 RepID=A0AAD4N4Y5_9BILA|nr:immunoglobulin domain-containing protein [Ditylenchus destructor]